jgi:predicted small lipoprotein YifL
MKKKLCRITALLLAAVLSLGGCGQPGLVKKEQTVHSRQKRQKIKKKISQKVIKKGRRLTALPMSRQWI